MIQYRTHSHLLEAMAINQSINHPRLQPVSYQYNHKEKPRKTIGFLLAPRKAERLFIKGKDKFFNIITDNPGKISLKVSVPEINQINEGQQDSGDYQTFYWNKQYIFQHKILFHIFVTLKKCLTRCKDRFSDDIL